MNTPDPSEGIDKAVPTGPTSIMVTEQSNPAAMIAVRAIATLPDEAEEELKALKERYKAEADAVNERFNVRHRDAWNALESALDLNSDDNHSLCSEHLDAHGVAFVTVEQRNIAPGAGIGGRLGDLLAQALGGRVTMDSPMGGVIEIDEKTLRSMGGNNG